MSDIDGCGNSTHSLPHHFKLECSGPEQAMIISSEPAPISTMAHLRVTPLPSSSVPWECTQTTVLTSLSSQPISLNRIIALSNPRIMLRAQAQSASMIVSPALQPIPAQLVRRIVSGDFVEMRELLSDNLALHDQLEAVHGLLVPAMTPGSLRARMWEMLSLISWVYCFTAYMAVRTSDLLTRDMLAYCCLIIQEALHHEGPGWQDYDRSLRTQAAINQSLQWNSLLPGLQAATILGQRAGGGVYCSLCRGMDHMAAICVLSYMQTTPDVISTIYHNPKDPDWWSSLCPASLSQVGRSTGRVC